jgi:hypothetical protein
MAAILNVTPAGMPELSRAYSDRESSEILAAALERFVLEHWGDAVPMDHLLLSRRESLRLRAIAHKPVETPKK